MTFHGSFYYQGLQVSRAWVVVHRSRQTWEFDTKLWPTNHFLTSSNVALHFKRKEIHRPNLYNLWTQSKSWFDRLLKMGIPVRSGEILLSKTKFYFWPIFRLFLDVFPQLSPTQVGETLSFSKNPWVFLKINSLNFPNFKL